MSQIMHANGQTRKTLAAQIDRLDAMLDNLSEGINDTVVTAVQEAVGQAVRQAVQTAITEVLTNEELQKRLRPAEDSADEPPAPRGNGALRGVRRLCGRLAGAASSACHRGQAAVRRLGSSAREVVRKSATAVRNRGRQACRRVHQLVSGIWPRTLRLYDLSRRVCRTVVVLLWIGLIAAAAGSVAGPFLVSVVSGLLGQVLVVAALARRPRWNAYPADQGNEAA